ncbi:histidine kinase [Streptosporangium sp. NPDC048865]|uniref:sensor histidine kinase n=1 Tax=Streptosporangium sp. NPDC048865 TaxID=3155766 RepID=UPI00341981E5
MADASPEGRRRWWESDTVIWCVAAAGLLLGAYTTTAAALYPPAVPFRVVMHAVTGVLYLSAGVVAHYRYSANAIGPMMLAAGIAMFAEDLQLSDEAWPHTVGQFLVASSGAVVTHLVLMFPTGRLETRVQKALMAVAYAFAAQLGVAVAFFMDQTSNDDHTPPGMLFVRDHRVVGGLAESSSQAAAAVVAVGLIVVLLRRWVTGRLLMRRLLAPVILLVLATGFVSATGLILHADPFPGARAVRDGLLPFYDVLYASVPLALLAGTLYFYLGNGAVNRLLNEMRALTGAGDVEKLLARSLRDDSLRLAYPAPAGFLDAAGALVKVKPWQAVTSVGGPRGAVLIHDALLREDPKVLDVVAAAAGLALTNQSLAATVEAQLQEVRRSRARILVAADTERKRIERNLHDGAQPLLAAAKLRIDMARGALRTDPDKADERLVQALENVQRSIEEIRILANGLYPQLLSAAGLTAAVRELGRQCPLPVTVDLDALPRLDPLTEASVYFVAAEGLTNAMKHAHATRARVEARVSGADVTLAVVDDGRGGATVSPGSGLARLADRVAAAGGKLTLSSPAGGGTTLEAVIPHEPPAPTPA